MRWISTLAGLTLATLVGVAIWLSNAGSPVARADDGLHSTTLMSVNDPQFHDDDFVATFASTDGLDQRIRVEFLYRPLGSPTEVPSFSTVSGPRDLQAGSLLLTASLPFSEFNTGTQIRAQYTALAQDGSTRWSYSRTLLVP